jgi:large subunit ribosomal protein L27
MAHKKGQGSTKNGRDSNPQYRGVKLFEGEIAQPGSIIVRQVGTPLKAGYQVLRGKDDTLFSTGHGKVIFMGRMVHVEPTDAKTPKPFWLTKAPKAAAPKVKKPVAAKK